MKLYITNVMTITIAYIIDLVIYLKYIYEKIRIIYLYIVNVFSHRYDFNNTYNDTYTHIFNNCIYVCMCNLMHDIDNIL